MAKSHLSSPVLSSNDRLHVYRTLFLLNRSFHLIVQRLQELDETRIFDSKRTQEFSGLTQELQTEINTFLLEPIESFEHEDCYRFGKVRIAMEKTLGRIQPGQKSRR